MKHCGLLGRAFRQVQSLIAREETHIRCGSNDYTYLLRRSPSLRPSNPTTLISLDRATVAIVKTRPVSRTDVCNKDCRICSWNMSWRVPWVNRSIFIPLHCASLPEWERKIYWEIWRFLNMKEFNDTHLKSWDAHFIVMSSSLQDDVRDRLSALITILEIPLSTNSLNCVRLAQSICMCPDEACQRVQRMKTRPRPVLSLYSTRKVWEMALVQLVHCS